MPLQRVHSRVYSQPETNSVLARERLPQPPSATALVVSPEVGRPAVGPAAGRTKEARPLLGAGVVVDGPVLLKRGRGGGRTSFDDRLSELTPRSRVERFAHLVPSLER